MRLAGQQKLGFFPAHPIAIAELLKHLRTRPPEPDKKFNTINILDPCCGKGLAIKQIADGLEIHHDHVYTVELDKDRTNDVKALMPEHHHLGPASFMGTQITGFSFGLAYLNPPFDNEIGGGRREEQAFVQHATPLLVHKGILALVCPLSALAGNGQFIDFLDANYEDLKVYKFPNGKDPEGKPIRGYNEICVIAKKRKEVIPRDALPEVGCLHAMDLKWRNYFRIENLPSLGDCQPVSWGHGQASFDREPELHTWEIPHSWRPNTFKKTSMTEDELVGAVANSPLNKHTSEVKPIEPGKPPLPLDRGHLGICIASGILDGRVDGPHGVHVVRGSSHKEKYLNREASSSEVNPETGSVTTKEVWSERMITVIRVAVSYPEAQIFTFSSAPQKDARDDEETDE